MAAGKGKLVLIDGNALVHRAFHALPPDLVSPSGEPTNATFGFTSMLLKVLADEEPEYIAVAFDLGRSFRHQEFAEYKAQRARAPEELRLQIGRARDVVRALNIPIFELGDYEADDLLGTLARQATEQGVETLIVTGDTDTFQLVGPEVRVLTSRGHFSDTVVYDEEGIAKRYGLAPSQLNDYKGLVGDNSDNIPGVRGIGPKSATDLLQRYGNLEGIYEHLEEIRNARVRKALVEGREVAFLSRKLVALVTEAPIELDLPACRVSDYERDRAMELFRELGFRTLVDKLPESSRKAAPSQILLFQEARPEPTYEIVNTSQGLEALLRELEESGGFAFDVEATGLDTMKASLVGLSFATAPGRAFYLPLGHRALGEALPQLPVAKALVALRSLFSDGSLPKYAHNASYDLTVMLRHGLAVEGLAFDTRIAAWLLNPSRQALGLKALAWEKLGVEMTPITELIGSGREEITMDLVPIDRAARYAAADADMTCRLVEVFQAEMRELQLLDLFREVEMPLVPLLVRMEMNGVALDVEFLHEMSRELYGRIQELEAQIHSHIGYEFNVNSTQQLGTVLFQELKLPAARRTKAGYSTAADVLEELRGQHPIIDLILEYRQLTKLKSTYIDALPLLVNSEMGRLHTSYDQTGTVTGRISSSDPNLQNIPIRTEVGRRIRRAFIAEPGHLLLNADYSQIDLRVLAHISGDGNLVAAFRRGEDIHRSTAAAVYQRALSEVTPEQRARAKTVNFAIVYGVSDYGLAQQSDLSREEARAFIDAYFAQYPGVKAYMERIVREAREQGYVATLLGRRRYFPELQREDGDRRSRIAMRAAERMAINSPVQGSAADIIKLAMLRVQKAIDERGLAARMILQVHDELVFEAPEEEIAVLGPLVKEVMEGVIQMDVPLKVDIAVGPNWGEMR